MTRLINADISDIAANLKNYDAELAARTGHTLSSIACRAVDTGEGRIKKVLPDLQVAVVPISSGQGIIGGFCDAVLSILAHMGANAFVTQSTDVAGIAEAVQKKADVMMLADDERFVALHIHSRKIADNAVCTARAFATGLNLMAGGVKGKAVLVIGCGPVGGSAAQSLVHMGARVSVYDINGEAAQNWVEGIRHKLDTHIQLVDTLDAALVQHRFILDASPAGSIIHAQHITPDTYVSAPGMPCGLDDEAKTVISRRMLHDPLQLGVATMLVSAARHHCEYLSES